MCEEQVEKKERLGWKHGNTPKRFFIGKFFNSQASLLKTKAAKTSKTTISPAKSWACSKASVIIMSVIISKIVTEATAAVAAMIS